MNDTDTIKEGDFFTLRGDQSHAYEVMECWPEVMTVKCSGAGCMHLPYSHFGRVSDLSKFKEQNIHRWGQGLEDHRIKTSNH
jgi:hypothetical protein